MVDHDWKGPWIKAAKFLNVIAAHTVTAAVLMGILKGGEFILTDYEHIDQTKFLEGTSRQFTTLDLFHASDLTILLLFIIFGIYHGYEELK